MEVGYTVGTLLTHVGGGALGRPAEPGDMAREELSRTEGRQGHQRLTQPKTQ